MLEVVTLDLNSKIFPTSLAEHDQQADKTYTKWPGWVRALIILGLSAALWTLIIAGALWLF